MATGLSGRARLARKRGLLLDLRGCAGGRRARRGQTGLRGSRQSARRRGSASAGRQRRRKALATGLPGRARLARNRRLLLNLRRSARSRSARRGQGGLDGTRQGACWGGRRGRRASAGRRRQALSAGLPGWARLALQRGLLLDLRGCAGCWRARRGQTGLRWSRQCARWRGSASAGRQRRRKALSAWLPGRARLARKRGWLLLRRLGRSDQGLDAGGWRAQGLHAGCGRSQGWRARRRPCAGLGWRKARLRRRCGWLRHRLADLTLLLDDLGHEPGRRRHGRHEARSAACRTSGRRLSAKAARRRLSTAGGSGRTCVAAAVADDLASHDASGERGGNRHIGKDASPGLMPRWRRHIGGRAHPGWRRRLVGGGQKIGIVAVEVAWRRRRGRPPRGRRRHEAHARRG